MKLTITTDSDEIYSMDVSGDLELENFKALCEFECGIPAPNIVVVHEGKVLDQSKKTLASYGVKENDVILIQSRRPQGQSSSGVPALPNMNIDFSNIQIPGSSNQSTHQDSQPRASNEAAMRQHQQEQPQEPSPEQLRQMFLNSPHDLSLLKENNPRLADALLSGDLQRFTSVLEEQQKTRKQRELARIRMINADPFDIEAQRQIAEEIRLKNVESNMEQAIEHAPESFGQVIMLYIDCHVNGNPVKAFVDSGAQTTIMSQACAERCNIMRLVDTRWAGIAKGVGTQKIIGRVHIGQIQIGEIFLASSFSILEDQPMDMLLGLDMLRRHQCIIDLKRNVLVIGTTGVVTPFLPESELPPCARLNRSDSSQQDTDDAMLARAIHESSKPGTSNPNSTATSAPMESSSQSQDTSSPVHHTFPETSIRSLMDLGFSREDSLLELQRQDGDVNKAAGALFAKSLKF